nr:hypothetical protein HmN_001019900 [Hymenolepis microstoma]
MAAAVGLLMKGVDDEEGGGGWGGEDTPSNLKASKLKIDEFLHELARLGHTRWPSLALFLRWFAVKVSASNRRLRNAHRRCLLIFRRNPTSASSIKIPAAAATPIPDPSQPVSYRPTTGASVRRHKRWRLHRQ